ncbi:hypothetical protein [Bacillus cihuensis]|uniref:hypothetical protein n=1 Tax=Bacillus cihuensis TaxID=1208599 RepID=UPI000421CE71|nr:hypothetical protein [Bacillus cihuensis]
MANLDTIYSHVLSHLKNEFESNEDFRKEIDNFIFFYGYKFMSQCKTESQEKLVQESVNDLIKSQYFQGYYIMTTLLNDSDQKFPETVWSTPKGMLRNEIPLFIETVFEGSDEWYKTELSHNITMNLIQSMDGLYDLIKQTRKDVALYGAYKAFIQDKRYKGNQAETSRQMNLGNPFDIFFLNPQIYMQAKFFTEEQEIWDLYTWTAFNNSKWVGTIRFSSFSNENNTPFYILEVSLSNFISHSEKIEIVNNLLNSLSDTIKASLQTRLYHVENMEVLVPNSDER